MGILRLIFLVSGLVVGLPLCSAQDNLRYYTSNGKIQESSNTCPTSVFAACGPTWEVRQSTTGHFRIVPIRPLAVVNSVTLQCPEGVGIWSDDGGMELATGTFMQQKPKAGMPAGCMQGQAGQSCYDYSGVAFSAGGAGGVNTLRISTQQSGGTCSALYTLLFANTDILGVAPVTYTARWVWATSSALSSGGFQSVAMLLASAMAVVIAVA
ncbi:hypothetical protein F751_6919 [Auxenochlorella protothecoides]|uniref:Uncharacterized protein n=1 Tax=Auxenochlorella protothecoides TaxID=3075 RepID=A0A087SDZ7_AUXPR|nr:hypothetical protein F751_6919 [Auxenochlorella protothecoides]KFM23951.1 hypothetical protein F751_6919 [Auxenochlorella protothecoides]RMZ54762.1 hypothetical protein APUTEX25_000279 [Auxenochlorella protothecoides]|eukprot:RMZ54762.1 hypothetical protein APUTEX25_000279 [Auxenochlorella protothecoides]